MPPFGKSGRHPRKFQTRLSFEPSSPSLASSAMSPARITYQDPRMPNKKEFSSSAFSQPHLSDENDDIFTHGKQYAVVVHSSPPLNNARQTQGKSFMAAASSSVKRQSRPRNSLSHKSHSESSDEEEVKVTTEKSKKRPDFLDDDSESSEPSLQSPPRAIVKKKIGHAPKKLNADTPSPKKEKNTSTRSFISGGYLDPEPNVSPRYTEPKRDRVGDIKPISRNPKAKEIIALSSDEHSDSEEFVELKNPIPNQQPAASNLKAGDAHEETKKTQISQKRRRVVSSEDDEPIRSSPTKRRKPVRAEEDPTDEIDSDSSIPAYRPKPTPHRTKQIHNARPCETRTNKAGSGRLTRQTSTPKKHRTDKQKKLELIRRRRAGEKIVELTESSSDGEMERPAYDTDSDLEALSVFDDEESAEGIEAVKRTLRPNVRNQDDDSFIVEDDDEPLGVPSHDLHEIPLEFTHQAHKPLKDHFKDAVEWMVQKKINPSFNRRDPIYIQAFRKLEPEARGLANSKFSSSAWSESFTRALWTRPAFHEEDIGPGDESERRKCDACGRSNHPAKFKIQLRGKAVLPETLEEVDNENDESDDDGEDSDRESVNSKGQKVLSEDTEFYLGRFCRANAERAHSLIHWKHALNDWVVQALEDQGFLEPDRLAERIKWSQRKLNTFANQIVDEWTDNGEIKSLYRDFKNNLEAARNQKPDRWNT